MTKITPASAARCASHTMAEQLASVREQLERQDSRSAAIIRKRREASDEWSDVSAAFETDRINDLDS